MSASDCPRGKELLAYATGDLPEDAAEQVAMHLDYCRNCQVFIDREMRSEDGLAAPLRRTMMSHAGEVSGYMENLMARAEHFVQDKADDAGGVGPHQGEQRSHGRNGQARRNQVTSEPV